MGGGTAAGTVWPVTAAPASQWLLQDGQVVAPAEVPATARGRARGLLGRDGIDGVMMLRPCRHVHTFRMRFPIDVAFCDRGGTVLRVCTLSPGRVSPVVWRSSYALEAEAGSFARWGVGAGDRVEIRS
jgi:uncharacterized membrane protein (UPF0127 family)